MASGAERQRRLRRRRDRGLIPLTVDVDEVALPEALAAAGFLRRDQTDDRKALRAATERFLAAVTVADLHAKKP